MTRLKCHVIHCASNKEHCCCRPDIKVVGEDACCSGDTCCDSYTSIPKGAKNEVGYHKPNGQMPINCSAVKCVYNAEGMCQADHIQMNGSTATEKCQTACGTFQPRS